MKKNKYLSLFIVCIWFGFQSAGLQAQETEDFNVPNTDETVNLGYSTLSKEANVGAIAVVSGTELAKTPTSTLSQTLAGRLSGLYTNEGYTELNRAGVSKWVRGVSTVNGQAPLIIIDGVISPTGNFEYITPSEIETITLLKDASTTAIYGIQGANGAIVITTKRGAAGQKKLAVSFDQSFQQMTRRPEFVSAYDYAFLRNQAGVNDGLGAYSQFSQNQMDEFKKGTNPLYPNNDWYNMFMRNMSFMERVGVSLSGGNEKMRYYSNINYMHESSPFDVADEPGRKYDPTPSINMVNFRTNLDLNFNAYISAFLRLAGSVDNQKTAQYDNNTIYSRLLYLPPTMYGPLTPKSDNPDDETGNQVVATDAEPNPVYGLLNRSGYILALRTNVMAQAGITMDMSYLTQGLAVSAEMAYQTYTNKMSYTGQDFERYVRSNDYSRLDFTKTGSQINTPLWYGKNTSFVYNLDLNARLDYNRRFGDHSINAMAYYFYMLQERDAVIADFTATNGAILLPYKRESMGVTALYGYRDKYFIKGDLGYSGSEQFHPDHRYIATPSVGAAWLVSKESFLSETNWLSLLKLRASYGISANDQLGDARYLFADFYNQWGEEGLLGNPNLSAEKIKKQNYGLDLGLFKSFSLTFDYYKHNVDNMLVSSTGKIPSYQGTFLWNFPRMNTGKMENKGYEVDLNYNKAVSEDLSVIVGAGISHNKNTVISVDETPNDDSYAYRYRTEGYSLGQQWGYLIDYSNGNGMFNSQSELSSKNLSYGNLGAPRVGDFIYQDLNRDGVIDDADLAPIGYSWHPEYYYKITGGLEFKGLEFSFLFQGIAKASTTLSGLGMYESEVQGVFNDIHKNAWTSERYANGEKIDYPALSLNRSSNHVANSYFVMDRSYLRLRNLEIAYTLPAHIARKLAAERIRIALNAQNLFTIDHLKSKYIDPEIGYMATFQPYRVYNIGVSLNF